MGRPKLHGERVRIQMRSSVSLITFATDEAGNADTDRNSWIVEQLARLSKRGLPAKMKTDAALSAIGGTRADLTIDVPVDVSERIDRRSEEWEIPRSTWINLALASVMGG